MSSESAVVAWGHLFVVALAGAFVGFLVPLLFRLGHRDDRGRAMHPSRGGLAGDSWARASVCIANGALVPTVAFVFTWLAASQGSRFSGEVWVIPMIVALVCVVSSSLLARSLFRPAEGPKDGAGPKTTVDEDAFDVVSRRG